MRSLRTALPTFVVLAGCTADPLPLSPHFDARPSSLDGPAAAADARSASTDAPGTIDAKMPSSSDAGPGPDAPPTPPDARTERADAPPSAPDAPPPLPPDAKPPRPDAVPPPPPPDARPPRPDAASTEPDAPEPLPDAPELSDAPVVVIPDAPLDLDAPPPLPVLSGIHVEDVTEDSAAIVWTTDAPASSAVDYGTTAAYGTSTPVDPTAVAAHRVVLSSLAPNTLYHYRVRSAAAGGESQSPDQLFMSGGTVMVGDCVPSGSGTDYQVGPGAGQLASLDLVPWESLGPGDTVRIFWQPASYTQKFVIHGVGTPDHPIRVCGVSGPSGQRPVIDGKNAKTRAGQVYRPTGEGPGIDMQNYALILLDGPNYGGPRPEYIIIDGLEIRGANSANKFTGTAGDLDQRSYSEGVACVRVQMGAHVILRNNEVHDCDNGLFSQTQEDWDDKTMKPHEPTITRDLLIDGNYIYGHGTATGNSTDRYHNSYIQSVGVVYQNNHYGPQRPGAHGSALKDRSIGTVVRYNRIEGCARALDLVEAENNPHMAMLDPAYRQTFVYGNLIRHDNDVGVAIHYGGDHYGGELWTLDNLPWPSSAYGESFFRKGTLYFFSNTVIIDATGGYGSSIFQLSTTEEHAEIVNNVLWVTGNPMYVGLRSSSEVNPAHWTAGGTVDLGVNVYNQGWMASPDPDHFCPGPLTGADNVIESTVAPVDLLTLVPPMGSLAIDAAQSLAAFPALASYPDDREYDDDLVGRARPVHGQGADLGALEGN